MKTKITVAAAIMAAIVLAVSLRAANSTSSTSDSDAVAALRKQCLQTQAQLDALTSRTTWLEQKVGALEQSNAQLQMEVRRLQGQRQGQGPGWSRPETNHVPNHDPHLTPLQNQ